MKIGKKNPLFCLHLCTLVVGMTPFIASAQMPVAELRVGMFRIEAEVAANQADRMQGLMFRQQMPSHRGMVFVFPEYDIHCMWMRNTYLPLSVAFLDEDGKIINIEDMQPRTETNHCSSAPARYAIEMNLGWFTDKKIGPGTKIEGIDRLPSAR